MIEFKAKEVFAGPMPHGFTWGLVLLKDLSKPPIPVGISYPNQSRKMDNIYDNVVNNANDGI